MASTGKGHHVYLRIRNLPESLRLDGIDVQADGHYVVAPPSIHANGNQYKFLNESATKILEINELSEIGLTPIPAIPHTPSTPTDDELLKGVSEGGRNNACISLAGKLKAKGLGYDVTLLLCQRFADNCNPPLPHEEAERCVKSSFGYLVKEGKSQAEALANAKAVVQKWLKLDDTSIIDLELATIAANKADGDPVWMLIVGAPGAGKSETLRGLFDCKDVYSLSSLTANTFVSGLDKAKGLLQMLPPAVTLVVKDFGSILTMRPDDKAAVLMQLREIYDGEYKRQFGTDKVVKWTGRMGLLAGVTSSIENHHSAIAELGNRYLMYRCELKEDDRQAVANMAMNGEGTEQLMRAEISQALLAALEHCPKPELVLVPDSLRAKIGALADVVARMRSPVCRNPYDKTVPYDPDIESPARLVKAFIKLAKSVAAVRGKQVVAEDEYLLIKRVGLDSVPRRRSRVVAYMVDRDSKCAKMIASTLNVPAATLNLELEDLMMLSILERQAELGNGGYIHQTTPNEWRLREKVYALIKQADLYGEQ